MRLLSLNVRLFLFTAISLLWAAAPAALGQGVAGVAIQSFTLSQSSVAGGTSVTGTITGYCSSDGQSYLVSVSSGGSSVVSISPTGFPVSPGGFTQQVTISTASVSTSTTVNITANSNGSYKTVVLHIQPPTPVNLTFASTSSPTNPPTAGDDATATVTLSSPAPSGGAAVALSVNNIAPSGATVTVPASVTVPAGSTTATFTVASSQNSVYDVTADITASYGGATAGSQFVGHARYDHAHLTSQNVPSIMVTGQTYPVSLTFTNDGNTLWSTTNGYKLGPADDNGETWNVLRTGLPNDVLRGQTVTFNFNVTAPSTPGARDFSRQMLEENVKRFEETTHASVSVRNANDAAFVSQTPPPATMTTGQTATVTVTMKNTGANTWMSGGANPYRLGSENPTDNQIWLGSANRVELPSSPVAPDGQAAFTITAPTTPGTYPFQWRMVQDGVPPHFGDYSPNVNITVVPPPVISSLSPTSAVAGGPAFTLTVNGSGFISGSIVKWNGATQTTSFTSSSVLTASIPASLLVTPGTVSITVTNPHLATSAPVSFTVTATPVISSLSPASIATGSADFTLTVNGSNLATDGVIKWNGQSRTTTFVSTAKLTATIPASLLTTAGMVPITVTNPHAATSGSLMFTVFDAPSITSLSPTSRTSGSTFTLTVNGTNFTSDAIVKWNGTPLTTHFQSSTQLTADLPSGGVTVSTGQVPITVTLPHIATTDPVTFTVYPKFNLSVSPATVTGGTSATGTITTDDPAPATMRFNVSDDSSAASVPSPVSIASGALSATFTVTTSIVSSTQTATLSAQNSNTTQMTTLRITPVFAAPTNLTATPGNNQVVLTWTGSSGATGYNIYRTTQVSQIDSVPALNGSTPLPSTPTSYTDSTAVNETTYYYIVRAVNANGESPDSNLVYATPDVPHIANLTLGVSAVTGGNTVTGTLTLSGPAPTGGSVVGLTSSDASVTVPASVTLAAGATSKNFTITTASISAATQVTIASACNKWSQASILTLLPTGQSFTIQNLRALSGNGCILLSWDDLPEGTIQGYKVYKLVNGSYTLLTSSPQQASEFADTGLTNTSTYQYKVSAVDTSGQEKTLSSPVSSIPNATYSVLEWVSPPSSASGLINLYFDTTSGDIPADTQLLVDGKVQTGGSENIEPAYIAPIISQLDTTALTNGTHTVQLIGQINGNVACATPPISLQVTNSICKVSVDDIAQPYIHEAVKVDATLSDANQWNVQILRDSDSSVIRTWSGSSSLIHLSWDGTDNTGSIVDDDNYVVLITSNPQGSVAASAQSSNSVKRDTSTLTSNPQGLALIDLNVSRGEGPSLIYDRELVGVLRVAFQNLHKNNPSFRGIVFTTNGTESVKKVETIKRLLTNNVIDFYLSGHGFNSDGVKGDTFYTPRHTQWGHTMFFADTSPSFHGKNNIFVNELVNRSYVFAFIDSCVSAGGTLATDEGTEDLIWSKAFKIGEDPNINSCFMGWNGYMSANFRFQEEDPSKTRNSNSYNFRQVFWGSLSDGSSVQDAYTLAEFVINGDSDKIKYGPKQSPISIRISPTQPGRTVFDTGLNGATISSVTLPYGLDNQ